MVIKIINNDFDRNIFNTKAINPLQSWTWGEARKKMGLEVLRIGEFTDNELKNAYQLTFHQIPHTSFKIGYLPRSPFPSKEVLDFLYDYGKKNNVVFIKIEPYEKISNIKYQISNLHIKDQILVKSPHPLFLEWTQILDLTRSEDELLKNMKPKTRYNIKLAQKKGVYVKEESNEAGFKIFSKLYFETCQRQKYYGHDMRYHKIVWETLKDNVAHILIAYFDNEPLAAYELFYFNKIFYYPYGGSSLTHRNFMATNLLMWEAIRLGKRLGARKFDMWGSLPPNYDPNDSWAGFTRFKEGYGGKFIKLADSYDLVLNPLIYQGYNFFYKIRQLYLQFCFN